MPDDPQISEPEITHMPLQQPPSPADSQQPTPLQSVRHSLSENDEDEETKTDTKNKIPSMEAVSPGIKDRFLKGWEDWYIHHVGPEALASIGGVRIAISDDDAPEEKNGDNEGKVSDVYSPSPPTQNENNETDNERASSMDELELEEAPVVHTTCCGVVLWEKSRIDLKPVVDRGNKMRELGENIFCLPCYYGNKLLSGCVDLLFDRCDVFRDPYFNLSRDVFATCCVEAVDMVFDWLYVGELMWASEDQKPTIAGTLVISALTFIFTGFYFHGTFFKEDITQQRYAVGFPSRYKWWKTLEPAELEPVDLYVWQTSKTYVHGLTFLFLFNLPQFLATIWIELGRKTLTTSLIGQLKLVVNGLGILKKIWEQRVCLKIEKWFHKEEYKKDPSLEGIYTKYVRLTWLTYVLGIVMEVYFSMAAACREKDEVLLDDVDKAWGWCEGWHNIDLQRFLGFGVLFLFFAAFMWSFHVVKKVERVLTDKLNANAGDEEEGIDISDPVLKHTLTQHKEGSLYYWDEVLKQLKKIPDD